MTPETFDKFCADAEKKFGEFFDDVNKKPDFDIENPMFFYGVWAESVQGVSLELFNDPVAQPAIFAETTMDQELALFKNFLQFIQAKIPERKPIMAAVTLTGGWAKDPKTMERAGEIICLQIEDTDRNCATWYWDLERPEEGPVKMHLKHKIVEHDAPYLTYGRMQNMFGHPPREAQEVLN